MCLTLAKTEELAASGAEKNITGVFTLEMEANPSLPFLFFFCLLFVLFGGC